MSAPALLLIDAVVDDTERPALVAATEQLRECLAVAAGSAWSVDIRFRASLEAIDVHDRPTVVVTSLLPELARHSESLVATEARWRGQLLSLTAMAVPAVLICTIFRHVADPARGQPDSRPSTRERIRRLNLLAIELSHDTGAGVVDIDRVCAHVGARALATDYRLTGRVAAEVAASAIVSSVVGAGLDDLISPQIQERAQQLLGNLRDVGQRVERQLTQRP